MKVWNRHIILCLFGLFSINSFASHIVGGEITYKHLKNNQYQVFLNIYRDCNGCKINGKGGGNSSENCAEIDFIFVRGKDNNGFKETKFNLTREKILDITPICRTGISACNKNPNTIYGIELHQFSAIVDLDNSKIKGYCNYYLFVSIAERNGNITTGQANQNFCVDAFIQVCLNSKNNSPNFTQAPQFIANAGKSQYQSCFATDFENDSLVYNVSPAMLSLDKEANYGSGFSYTNPLTVYCTETPPCKGDKSKETGFYLDQLSGTIVFIPTMVSEIAVITLRVDEYRKISGKWELIGYIKRDFQLYVKSSDGNNSPKFLNSQNFEACEDEKLSIKIETRDDLNSSTMNYDSVHYIVNSDINGSSFIQYVQSSPPYGFGVFQWTPPKGSSSQGIYKFSISAYDNFCPLNAVSTQTISIKVKPKEVLSLDIVDLGCGNYSIASKYIDSKSKLKLKVYKFSNIKSEIFTTLSTLDTISRLERGKYLIVASLMSSNGCETILTDSITYNGIKTTASIIGLEKVCEGKNYEYLLDNFSFKNIKVNWVFSNNIIGNGLAINHSFSKNGKLYAFTKVNYGKWVCEDTVQKEINVIKTPSIISEDIISVCHNSEKYNLKDFIISPNQGNWKSNNSNFDNGMVNTVFNSPYYNDTLLLKYQINNLGCISEKTIVFVVKAIPEFELNNLSICEMANAIRFEQLIKKPYNILDYQYKWQMPLFPSSIKEVNGYKSFYPIDVGFGQIDYIGQVISKNGCSNFDSAIVEITPQVKIKFLNPLNLCQKSGSIDISKLSGVTPDNGNWSFYDFDLISEKKLASTDSCGQFELNYIYDHYGCYDSKKITLNIVCKPKMQILSVPQKICDNQLPVSLASTPEGGVWEGDYITGSRFLPPLINENKTHQINYIVNKDNCNFKETVNIKVVPTPQINFKLDKLNFCKNEPITFSGNLLNSNYLDLYYTNESKNLMVSPFKNYDKEIFFYSNRDNKSNSQLILANAANSDGCKASQMFLFDVYQNPILGSIRDTTVCENSNYTVRPNVKNLEPEFLAYKWVQENKVISENRLFNTNQLSVGSHKIKYQVNNGLCFDSKSFNINIYPKPFVDFIIMPTNVSTISQPSFNFVNKSESGLTHSWDFGTGQPLDKSTEINPKFTYTDTGIYPISLLGINSLGCMDVSIKNVSIRPDILVFIPNSFSPNGKDEEKNNEFKIVLQNYRSFSMEVFDRWGHKVFVTDNPTTGWDCKTGDVICTPDIYFYVIKINSISSHFYQYRGTITLIK